MANFFFFFIKGQSGQIFRLALNSCSLSKMNKTVLFYLFMVVFNVVDQPQNKHHLSIIIPSPPPLVFSDHDKVISCYQETAKVQFWSLQCGKIWVLSMTVKKSADIGDFYFLILADLTIIFLRVQYYTLMHIIMLLWKQQFVRTGALRLKKMHHFLRYIRNSTAMIK